MDNELAAVRLDQLFGHKKAKSEALSIAPLRALELAELFEELADLILRDAFAVITDAEAKHLVFVVVAGEHDDECAGSLRELERVFDQIYQYLLQSDGVSDKSVGERAAAQERIWRDGLVVFQQPVLNHFYLEVARVVLHLMLEHVGYEPEELVGVKTVYRRLNLNARLDQFEIEQVIDELEQEADLQLDHFAELALSGIND